MNLKSLVYLVLFFIYCLFCWKYYTCDIKGFCNEEKNSSINEIASFAPPVQFNKNTDQEVLNNFSIYSDSVKNMSLNANLDIVGQYYSDEINNKACTCAIVLFIPQLLPKAPHKVVN